MVGRDTHLIEDCGMELNLTAQVREENNAVWDNFYVRHMQLHQDNIFLDSTIPIKFVSFYSHFTDLDLLIPYLFHSFVLSDSNHLLLCYCSF